MTSTHFLVMLDKVEQSSITLVATMNMEVSLVFAIFDKGVRSRLYSIWIWLS